MNNFAKEGNAVNWTNASGAVMVAGLVYALGDSGLFGVPVVDIPVGGVGAVQRTGVYKVPKGAETPDQGDLYKMVLATQTFDDTTGVTIGSIDEVRSGSILVLLNNLPGTVATA